jgi:hypothetical protein
MDQMLRDGVRSVKLEGGHANGPRPGGKSKSPPADSFAPADNP